MSYDSTLKDPVTNEAAEVPGHLMTGGTYKAFDVSGWDFFAFC